MYIKPTNADENGVSYVLIRANLQILQTFYIHVYDW